LSAPVTLQQGIINMAMSDTVTLYHAPNSRSSAALTLLEELGAPYRLHVLNLNAGDQRQPAYLAVNPMGKVPAITHGGALITEQVAIFIYLADLFSNAGLAPQIGDPLRGPYLRWLVFYGSCFEPAIGDRALKREPAPQRMSAYGDYDGVLAALVGQLRKGPYMLGERFSAADVLWGTAFSWTTGFKLVPELPEITAYLSRWNSRPSVARVEAKDAELTAQHEAAAGTKAATG
jgi:glutathione S-transferase